MHRAQCLGLYCFGLCYVQENLSGSFINSLSSVVVERTSFLVASSLHGRIDHDDMARRTLTKI